MAKRSGMGLWLISCAVLVVCMAWAGEANAAPQDFNQLLRGDYAFTGEAVCVVSPGGFTTGPTPPPFIPIGTFFINSFSIQGIRTFNGDGTGTIVARNVNINQTGGGVNAADLSGDFTYQVAPDRSFTVVQGPITGIVVVGPGAGSTAITIGVKFSGKISQDHKTLVMSTEEPTVEIRTPILPPGPDSPRICHRARTAIKIK